MNHMLSSDNLPPGDLIHLFQTQTIFLQNIRNPFRHGNVEGLAQSLDLKPRQIFNITLAYGLHINFHQTIFEGEYYS